MPAQLGEAEVDMRGRSRALPPPTSSTAYRLSQHIVLVPTGTLRPVREVRLRRPGNPRLEKGYDSIEQEPREDQKGMKTPAAGCGPRS